MKKNTLLSVLPVMVLLACSPSERATEKAPEQVKEVVTKNVQGPSEECLASGPQTPRDISNVAGTNSVNFALAPASSEMNLCNIHTHTNAEHKGPDYSVFVNDTDWGGYACNETANLTDAEKAAYEGEAYFDKVKPGDTIEVHWVHTSCDINPGPTLGACLTETCTPENALLRVCLLYTSPSPRDQRGSRMPSSA